MDPSSGGPCQGIRNSIPELEKLGVHNEVVSLDNPAAAFLGKDPFTITALGPGKSPWCFSSKLIPWLVGNLGRFDAVIVHGLWLYNGYATYKAMRHIKISSGDKTKFTGKVPKLFIMPHGMLDPYFQRTSARKLKAVRNWAYWKIIEEKLIHAANAVLFTTETELQLARETFTPYNPHKEINVGYGIKAPPEFSTIIKGAFFEKFPQLKNRKYILFLSRIHDKKGVDLLIEAYAKILSDNSGADAAKMKFSTLNSGAAFPEQPFPLLVIAGPGLDTPFGEKIKAAVSGSAQLQKHVVFTGMLAGAVKWEAFYGCEAFILPSHQENFGIAVAEALACSKPVLISDQVNIWREIKTDGAGIVSTDTLEGTKEILDNWLGMTSGEKVEMSRKAKICFENNFAIAPAAAKFLEAVRN